MKNITSIDYEEKVIKKMQNRGVPIDYKCMDMMNMDGIADGSVDFIFDKGSLDALCCDREAETQLKVHKYLNEVLRVLAVKGGTFICVSLLQDFLFDGMINFFCHGTGNNYYRENILDFRVQRIEKPTHLHTDGSQSFLPFFVTVKRTKVDPADEKM